jgi:23S rRNA (adenine2503-C2)-methyltransferase
MERALLKNYSLAELEAWVEGRGERRFRARQLFRHLYARQAASWGQCSDLGRAFREELAAGTHLDVLELADKQEAPDGTLKYLFSLLDGHQIEAVFIPDAPRYTLCLSSQVGCALGCRFCLTGSLGFKRNLQVAEIVDQVCQVQRDLNPGIRLTNLVLMGMGEPLANYDAVVRALAIIQDPNGLAFSHRRITLSTAGLVPQMRRLGNESPVNLAVSLHAAEDMIRGELMPINHTYPLDELLTACRDYPLPARKYITFEYLMLDGVNDSPAQARKLVRLLHGIRAKVNLIPFNEYSGSPYRRSSDRRIMAFQEVLQMAHLTATVRQSRGVGVGAACGQLVARYHTTDTAGERLS